MVRRKSTRASRDRTRAAHRELAEAAKAIIARSFAQPLSLARLASRLRTSPYHLARVFRAETGFIVDGYQRSLRVRTALERLPSYPEGLTTLALELGFSSHSHFTETFRREFGVRPPPCVSDLGRPAAPSTKLQVCNCRSSSTRVAANSRSPTRS
jgi:AraC family transcriptional regulator